MAVWSPLVRTSVLMFDGGVTGTGFACFIIVATFLVWLSFAVGFVCAASVLVHFAVLYVYSLLEFGSETLLSVSESLLFVFISSSWIYRFVVSVFCWFVVSVQLFVHPLICDFIDSILLANFFVSCCASANCNFCTAEPPACFCPRTFVFLLCPN